MTDEARAGEPRTEAGRALVADIMAGHDFQGHPAQIVAAIEREAAAELWQQGYAAGLERGRQPDNHPEAAAAPALDVERLALLAASAEDSRFSDEWVGSAFRAILRLSQPSPDEPTPTSPVAPLGEPDGNEQYAKDVMARVDFEEHQ